MQPVDNVRVLRLAEFRGRGEDVSLATVYESDRSRGRFLVAKTGHGVPSEAAGDGDRAILVVEGRMRAPGAPTEAPIEAGSLLLVPRGTAQGVEAVDRWTLAAFLYETRSAEPFDGVPRAATSHEANPRKLQGNAFVPVYETPESAAGVFHIDGGRRMTTGPESERTFLILEGTGLIFLEDESTLPVRAGDVAIVQAGYAARLWARGPGPLAGVVFQPQMERSERRTLRGELTKLKDELAKRRTGSN